ncbi:MAG TPA: hypothetical protein DIU09_05640 [Hyphomonadaceae bacterium]|nr:hypothetical protein AEM38_08960 [Hyphomonadaceae bacterium UKL13-1]HCP64057.1 hypothetical protein [Hyphomonadaceae bacterium]
MAEELALEFVNFTDQSLTQICHRIGPNADGFSPDMCLDALVSKVCRLVFAIHASNPLMTFLLLLSIVVSAGLMFLRWRTRAGRVAYPNDVLAWIGFVGLLLTWGLFVPVNIWATLAHEADAWIFGSEKFDGGIVETSTVVFYALAILSAIVLFRRAGAIYGVKAGPMWRVILMLGIFGFIAMIGEEISWGQHWLGFATPASLSEANLQHEANLHNLISPRLYDVIYQGLGWSLILCPPIAVYFGETVRDLTIVRFLRDCFSWPATYALMVSAGILLQHEAFEELSEMVLAFAVFYALLSLALRTKKVSGLVLA